MCCAVCLVVVIIVCIHGVALLLLDSSACVQSEQSKPAASSACYAAASHLPPEEMTTKLTYDTIRRAPKVVLHDHLDGGLRPATIVDIARREGYNELPATDSDGLAAWFRHEACSGSLMRYLETFAHTIAVMQSATALTRIAREAVEDLADDGVVYAEIRWAPEQHTRAGLDLDEVVVAVLRGLRQGEVLAAQAGHPIRAVAIVCAMRHATRSREIAELAVRFRDVGIVGYDIAGAEAGCPPTRHLDAFEYLRRENCHFTIHAGEAFGLPSIWEAVQCCGATRIGHAVSLADDITAEGTLGRVAQYVRDRRIPLEMCPSSNVQTGAAKSIAEHPIGLMRRLQFRVTVNTDNRLMSATSMSRELLLLAEEFDYGWADLQWFTVNAMKSAFIGFDERLAIINTQINPVYAALAGVAP